MRPALKLLSVAGICAVSASYLEADSAAPRVSSLSVGCLVGSPSDTARFLQFVRSVVDASAPAHARLASDLPVAVPDSVQVAGTSVQCDSVSSRYGALLASERGDTTWALDPVMIARVAPNRFVADPRVTGPGGYGREWITLDSAMNIVKVWRTFP